jgi:hypothetical protein
MHNNYNAGAVEDTRCARTRTLLDLGATFDTVDHNVFVQVLQMRLAYMQPIPHSWFASYVDGRQQFSCVSNERSHPDHIPYGSVFGAVEYNAKTIRRYSANNQFRLPSLFADDTQLLNQRRIDNTESTVRLLEHCVLSRTKTAVHIAGSSSIPARQK